MECDRKYTCSMSRTLDVSKYKFLSLSIYIYTHTHTYTTCTHKYTNTFKYYINTYVSIYLFISMIRLSKWKHLVFFHEIYIQLLLLSRFSHVRLCDPLDGSPGVSKHLCKELYWEYFRLCGQNICHMCLNVQCETTHKTSVNECTGLCSNKTLLTQKVRSQIWPGSHNLLIHDVQHKS